MNSRCRTTPSVKRTLAAEILKYVAQKRAENEAKPDYAWHQVAYHMMLDNDVVALWKHAEPKYGMDTTYHLETVRGQDGVERLEKVMVRKSFAVPEPVPGPMPQFEPAVSVLPPSDVEKQAVKESSLTFDERYSPGAVAARVAAIENEAAQIRASRGQTE